MRLDITYERGLSQKRARIKFQALNIYAMTMARWITAQTWLKLALTFYSWLIDIFNEFIANAHHKQAKKQ